MLTLKRSILTKYMTLFGVVLFSMYIISYSLMQDFVGSSLALVDNADAVEQIVHQFNVACMQIAVVSVIAFFIAFYFSKRISDRVSRDVLELKIYLEDINAKDYESIIKIEHYAEFLEISILLKNIVKRLKQKSKK